MLKLYSKFQDPMLKGLEHLYISVLFSTCPVLQLTGPGCEVTSRELQTLKEGVDRIDILINV